MGKSEEAVQQLGLIRDFNKGGGGGFRMTLELESLIATFVNNYAIAFFKIYLFSRCGVSNHSSIRNRMK